MTRTTGISFIAALALFVAFASPAYASSYGHYHDDWNRPYDERRERIPYCTIKASPNTVGYGQSFTISWDSTDGEYADITDIGRVSADGSRTIQAYTSKTYYMTVYNGSKSSTCSTFVNIPGDKYYGGYTYYNYPTYSYPVYTYPAQSYVRLTQIPYTGLDLGTMGEMLYWLGMIVVALGFAYLVVYSHSGAAPRSFMREVAAAARNQMHFVRGLVR